MEAVSDEEREMIRRYAEYVLATGFGVDAIVGRLERLKFETIVQEKSYREVLAEAEES